MEKPKILDVDDEQCIREFIQDLTEGFAEIHSARDGKEAFAILEHNPIDLILMDLLMPGEDGIQLGGKIRKLEGTQKIPLIMMTGRNDSQQRTRAFESGFDDYIAKPFVPNEFVARVRSKLDRFRQIRGTADQRDSLSLKVGDLHIDLRDLNVRLRGQTIDLGTLEFKVLYLLVRNIGNIVDRRRIEDYLWSEQKPSARALDPHIFSLRKKLRGTEFRLQTAYKGGYALIHTPSSQKSQIDDGN